MIKNNFSTNLKNLRIKNDIKQSTLAKQLNISQGAYAKYENGQREPSFDILIKISKIFKVSTDELLNNSLTPKIINTLTASISYESNPDISKEINLIDSLNKKKAYYLKEQKRLQLLLNKHIPNRLKEIDELLDILNNNPPSFLNNNENLSTEISPTIIDWQKYKHRKKNIKYRTIPILGDISAGNPCYAEGNIIDLIPIPESILSPYKEYYILNIKGDSMNKLFANEEPILVECTNYVSNYSIAIVRVGTDDATVKKVVLDENYISLIPMSTNNTHKSKTYNIKDVCIQGKVIGKLSDLLNTSL